MWSRDYSPRNTRLLRALIRGGRIIVDIENGIVMNRRGKPFALETNFFGYKRFRVMIRRRGKRINAWFFVHKAVMLADGLKLRHHWEINHIDRNRANNRRDNLEYIHRSLNLALREPEPEIEAAF